MAKLSDVDFSKEPEQVIVYGPPKSGKTELVSKLAHSHKIIWIDLENGGRTLAKLPKELKDRIEYIRVFDTPGSPNAIETALRLIQGTPQKVCDAHGKITCSVCLTKRDSTYTTIELAKCDPADTIVVWDSFTQMTASATNKVAKQFDVKIEAGKKFEFDHWNMLGVYLRMFLETIQNASWNNVVISHEAALKLEDSTDKLVPAGGTENFSRNVARYFGQVVYTQVLNMNHKASSSTTAHNKILTGSRTDVVIDLADVNPLGKIFSLSNVNAETATEATPAPAVQAKSAVQAALEQARAKQQKP